jgi:N-acetylneuraminic acid mutarotase
MYHTKIIIKGFILLTMMFTISSHAKSYDWSNVSQQQYIDNLVACQTQLQAYKWSKNIWPESNKKPKPAFSEMVDVDQIRQKVLDNLYKQNILSTTFNIDINHAMLQHDIDRMARNTKDAKGLKAMFALFDNDPTTIAQCISRPYLVDKKTENSFNQHNIIHQEIKEKAEQELSAYMYSKNSEDMSARVSNLTYKVNELGKGLNIDNKESSTEFVIELNEQEFQLKLTELENQSLQQKPYSFVYSEIVKQDENSMTIKSLIWPKIRIDQWLNSQVQNIKIMSLQKMKLILPKIVDDGESYVTKSSPDIINTWKHQEYFPDARILHTAVWSGSEMIIWGGASLNTGGRYNPSSDSWTATTRIDAPSGRSSHTAIWSGSEMIVWGGTGPGGPFDTGGRYDPNSDTWVEVNVNGAPSRRTGHTSVWNGSEMLVWGGKLHSNHLNTGGRYDPFNDSWSVINTNGAPSDRYIHTAIWSGSEMIIWGGNKNNAYLDTGGRYNPVTDSWITTNSINAPSARYSHTAIWDGNEMIVWGGDGNFIHFDTGGRYDPNTDSWTQTSLTNAPNGRHSHSAVWSGTEMIIWGGVDNVAGYSNTGGRYNPKNDSWTTLNLSGAPVGRVGNSSVWTGSELIVWGGRIFSNHTDSFALVYTDTGGRYDPSKDSWSITSFRQAPFAANRHKSVWSGNEMIVWGGYNGDYLNIGARYNPISDNWNTMSTVDAPDGRVNHTAIWTGSEMIVWGGNDESVLTTGSRYHPINDSWNATSPNDNSEIRSGHTAVWTGSEMIIWGGLLGNFSNTGWRYDPTDNSWTATSTIGAPMDRQRHTAVWNGTEMMIWGGQEFFEEVNTGSRYNPSTDSWNAISIIGAPDERYLHTAVWSGSEMIVWGGYNDNYLNTGGRYDPNSDNWTSTNNNNTPVKRSGHTAVWTDKEMIIWGGSNNINNYISYFDSGARYDPNSNSWIEVNMNGAPSKRTQHTAVWSGNDMIVWGGRGGVPLNSIGIYYPYTDILFKNDFE